MATDTASPTRDNPGAPGTLLFENDRVRVWELILEPGESCAWHVHDTDHLLVVFEGCSVEAEFQDGRSTTAEIADRVVMFIPRGEQSEIARNTSTDRTLRELIIDIKEGGVAGATSPKVTTFFGPGTASTARAPS